MENSEKKVVKVRIFGQEYSIRATVNEAHIRECAALVDSSANRIFLTKNSNFYNFFF